MDIVAIRAQLHQYIDTADEQHLSAIFVLVEDNIPSKIDIYDEDTMNMLYQRRENHRNGISKSYTVEESMKIIKEHRK